MTHTEIEAKLKVDSHSEIEYKLFKLQAQFLGELFISDYLFDDANSSLTQSDICLRLRSQRIENDIKLFLTYKGPQQKSNFKKRQEIEFEAKDVVSIRKFLSVLGYESNLNVFKRRRLWKLDTCEIALDFLQSLGYFIEIEGPDEIQIIAVQKALGLSNHQHITKSYAALIRETKNV